MPQIEDLEAQFQSARAAVEAYSGELTVKYRELHPDPADWTGPGPHPETAVTRAMAVTGEESAELDWLRKAATQAALELHRARDAAKTDGGAE